MKKLISTTLLSLFTMGVWAQDADPIDEIYRRYEGEKFSIAVNLDASIFKDFDIDIDTDDLEQRISGTVRRLRFIAFEDYRPGLRNAKEIIEDLYDLGYELATVPEDWQDEDSQILILKKKGQKVSPHLIIIANNRSEKHAAIIILSGDINFKSAA